ncbi:peptidase, M23/M37 family [Phenylobacterium zucineum HLK1]|uniref:Peptidase, M23/M37 family n=1 Tax=Phenylobacterium zucineum (strain HLK1) TaxID=450851 RepID=B4RD55_PHEZH|nr:peptidoglycan DD-metalloendopeptidase family protein [Phenylobacterium zucineum]ACG76659.1 peptidase, M23/M37 family [Phenylobacterium zucineum HLK1]
MRGRILIFGGLAAAALSAVAFAATTDQLTRLNLAETEISAEQARNRHRLARMLSVLEQLRRDPPPALLVSPDDAKDAVRAAILVKAVTPELQARARSYAKDAGEVMRQRRLAAVQSEALFERESLQAESLPEPQSKAGLALRGPVATLPPGVLKAPATLLSPTPGPIVRRFGEPLAGGGQANGVTLAAPRGARVAAPGDGVVQYVGPVKGWGVILILRLAGGYHLVLAGLERTSVEVGQSVAAGQPVGWAAEGRQSTSELYLEVREQGSPVDPGRWLNKRAG